MSNTELNACTQCGFTTRDFFEFTSHIDQHEKEHQYTSVSMLASDQVTVKTEWSSEGSDSRTPSPPSTSPTNQGSPELELMSSQETPSLKVETPGSVSFNTLLGASPVTTKGNKRLHSCPFCNFTTCMSQHMKSHLEAHERHQGQMYQCDICQMQFSQKANMHRHRMRHTGVKPYECRYCKKRFFRKDQMQEHSMTHIKTGFGFDCPVAACEQQFCQHSMLRAHLDEKHSISATAPASCKRCALLFSNSRRLLLHYQTRHDENEKKKPSDQVDTPTARKNGEPPAKRRRTNNRATASVSPPEIKLTNISEQLQDFVKKELSPPHSDSENSASPEYEPSENYPLSSGDLLMMCLSGATMPIEDNNVSSTTELKESATQIWPENSESCVSGEPGSADATLSPSEDSASRTSLDDTNSKSPASTGKNGIDCTHCGIVFFDNTMYLLHKGLHSEGDPWRCNLCGFQCGEKYMFTTHSIFANHSGH